MIPRACRVPDRLSFFLFGPRQTGKTTLIRSLLPEHAYSVNLLLEDRFLELAKNSSILREEVKAWIDPQKKKQVLFIDEIQKLPHLLDEIHHLIESYKNLQVILTGSSARKLRQKGVNLLGGRAVEITLHPFTWEELGGSFDLETALRFGTLPSLFTAGPSGSAIARLTELEQRLILEAYVNTYLKEEIRQEALVRQIGDFSRFLEVAAFQSGEILSCSNMSREAGVNRKTVEGYYAILEDTLIGFKLFPWRRSARKRLIQHPKFYFFDLGLVNALTRVLTSRFTPLQRGRLFETFLILETRRIISYQASEANLHYWRTNTGSEIDLLIEKHGTILGAFEFKSGRALQNPSTAAFKAFASDYPKVPRYVVAEIDRPRKNESAETIPWRQYLKLVSELS